MIKQIKASVEQQWYSRPSWLFLLLPLMWLFMALSHFRRARQQASSAKPPVPVIIIGNIAVGGTGKTPVIIALAKHLQRAGFNPGVVSRGYGASFEGTRLVESHHNAEDVGDEPLLIHRAVSCPVVVGRKRTDCAERLHQEFNCDVILSDDGLQHYLLGRTYEIAVIDGARFLGNGWHLPVGPLREGRERLKEVNWILQNGNPEKPWPNAEVFSLQPVVWQNVKTGEQIPQGRLGFADAVAVAGIGNPQRFFNTLKSCGFKGKTLAFADHHQFRAQDFAAFDNSKVLMTEKDAIKCKSFAKENWWALLVEAHLPQTFLNDLSTRIKKHISESNN